MEDLLSQLESAEMGEHCALGSSIPQWIHPGQMLFCRHAIEAVKQSRAFAACESRRFDSALV